VVLIRVYDSSHALITRTVRNEQRGDNTMRSLITKAERLQYRAAIVPVGAVADERNGEHAQAFRYCVADILYAVAFIGSSARPTWHYRFRTEAARDARINSLFESVAQSQAYKQSRRVEQGEQGEHDVKVGDVFRCSWGYDQTNIDYYQCVELRGKRTMIVREIQQESQETQSMQGECVPVPGKWATEPDYSEAGEAYKAQHGHYPRKPVAARLVRIQLSSGKPCFRVASYACAYREEPVVTLGNKPIYRASHWTAYA